MTQTPEISPIQNLAKRGRAVYFSSNYKVALGNACPDSPLRQKYFFSTYCNKSLTVSNGKVSGKHCGYRWCVSCNRIRTAKLINTYLPTIKGIEDPRFVTLTLKNCNAADLKDRVKWMIKAWASIQKYLRRKRGTVGYRKLEITHNLKFNDFHPHFHAIINGEANAKGIISKWMSLCNKAGIEVDIRWQDQRPADLNSMKELFKYTAKLLPKRGKGQSWDDLFKGRNKKILQGQDTIFQALQGVRAFQPFGFKPMAEIAEDESILEDLTASPAPEDVDDGIYISNKAGDWVSIETGAHLHGKPLSDSLVSLVDLITSGFNFGRKLRRKPPD